MSVKAFTGIQVKDADQGTVQAVFSTFDVKDHDGDVTPPGAFEDGAEVVISAYGHTSWGGMLPVGKGTISQTKTQAILDGQFFLDTQHGADTFKTVKALGRLGQWSYGYDVLKASYGEHNGDQVRFLESLKVHEVSPVLIGAGIGTATLAAKGLGLKYVDEATAVLAAVKNLADRTADVMAKRAERGKSLGGESTQLLEDVEAELTRLAGLLKQQTDGGPEPVAELQREYLRFLRAGHPHPITS